MRLAEADDGEEPRLEAALLEHLPLRGGGDVLPLRSIMTLEKPRGVARFPFVLACGLRFGR